MSSNQKLLIGGVVIAASVGAAFYFMRGSGSGSGSGSGKKKPAEAQSNPHRRKH